MTATTAIKVRGLTKSYGDVQAVRGIDLDIRAGEVFAVLGPNGAGKSTTVEILEGHRKRDGGEVSVLSVDPGRPTREWRSRIGVVLQTIEEAGDATVREMVRHFARYYPDPRDPDEVIEQVGLAEKAGTRVRELSGGQRRRVDVALGIIGRPELLFLDEPTTGFDPEARRRFWELISGLSDDGTTIVLTTHYLDEAEALADRVAVIAWGRIVAEGDPHTLGGRATAKASVSWSQDGVRHSVETGTPSRTVAELARRFDGEVPELAVTRPTLEDIYLKLIETPAAAGQEAGDE
ncbi:ABC-2 type transport system ATP-binding protein [Thermocatellispora tengchongensis]|uniref:ABC-2 type transport system ATP-binding protein n=1 Tax=Thermocatellispora tengchongensis TaxID=1073253 RepID=A0A840PPR3_9ACTN|nr:ABC transporter ATP-binding protein [Thermocatellispora tengchongensis]MBB5138005.1 ABC-2 type transport system ATP-binding protein [Thermocatellispora tengchongensis]